MRVFVPKRAPLKALKRYLGHHSSGGFDLNRPELDMSATDPLTTMDPLAIMDPLAMDALNLDTLTMDTTEKVQPRLPSFHELSSGGYNGRLAMAYRSPNRVQNIMSIADTMMTAGERPVSTMSYNYILSALLDSGQQKKALCLLKEMEQHNILPDAFTFELLLLELSKDSVMAITVDESFQLMKVRYELKPTTICWFARIRAWMTRRNEVRVIQLVTEMQRNVRVDPDLHCSLARIALQRNLWSVAGHFFKHFESSSEIKLTSMQYFRLWQVRQGRPNPRMVPMLRWLFANLDGLILDEGSYARLLYFCSRMGNTLADLSFLAIRKLAAIYKEPTESTLPRVYLKAFVDCCNTETDPMFLRPPYLIESRLEEKHLELARKVQALLL
jgi:pentatricopeptide repeat protein